MVAKTSNPSSTESPLLRRPRAIVIGASSGIGAAIVEKLAGEGYLLAALARRDKELQRLCNRLTASGPGEARAFTHDVTKTKTIAPLFKKLFSELGGIDTLIYVAGAQPSVALDEFNWEKDEQMLQVNLAGAVAWLGQTATFFNQQGYGQIVGISSLAGDRGRVMNPVYSSSKAGLDAYLESLRNRLTRKGVHVLTVKPGFVDTVLLANAPTTFGVISPAKAADGIYRAMQRGSQLIYVPWWWRWIMRVIRWMPSFIFRKLSI